jgi:copper transport protein
VASWPSGRTDPRSRRILMIAWIVAIGSAVGSLLLQGPYAAGTSLGSVVDPERVGDTVQTSYGVMLLARLALLVVAAVVLRWLLDAEDPVSRTRLVVIGALGVALAATWSGAGHPAAAGSWVWVALPLDAAHLAAVSIWLGGLVILVGSTLSKRGRAGEEEAATAVSRYSRSAAVAVVVLGGTGLLQAIREIAASGIGTEYFSLLVFKIGAFGLLLWLAALSRAAVQRQLAVRSEGRKGAARKASRDMIGRLRLSVRWEVGIAVVVLGLTAALVATPPGGHDHGPGAVAAASTGPFLNALSLPGSGDVQVWVDPARTGDNQIVLNVRDGQGINRDVPEVQAQLRLPANNIGPLPVTLARTGPGQFVADKVVVPVAGMWQLSLRVRSTDFDEATVDAQIQMR